jgi:TolA-binding protein
MPFPSARPRFLLPILGCVLLQAQESDLAERLFRSGERAYAAKSVKEALDSWTQLLQSAPKSDFAAQAMLRLARHQWEVEHKADAALPLLDRIKAEQIRSTAAPEALVLRGEILAAQARKPETLKEAQAEWNRTLDLFPDHPAASDARFDLGLAAKDLGKPGSALVAFQEVFRSQPDAPVALRALLQAADLFDQQGDLNGCLRLLQRVRNVAPQSPEAAEALWRITVRVRHRIQKPALRNEGPWPAGKVKWLKTPTLLATTADGGLLIYQSDLDRAYALRGADLVPVGPAPAPSGKALLPGSGEGLGVVTKAGLMREDGAIQLLPNPGNVNGGFQDRWGQAWLAEPKNAGLLLVAADGSSRNLPSPAANAVCPRLGGGAVIATDASRSLSFVDLDGKTLLSVPYGKDLPAAYKEVTALASDGAGHTAALVDGGEFGEGIVIYGPDGAVLRSAGFKALGVNGRITSLVLDRQGGVILCDRRNDTLVRLF